MVIEGGFPNNKESNSIKSLSESLAFLNIQHSEEEKNYNIKLKKASDLMKEGKMDEAIALSITLRNETIKNEMPIFTKNQEKIFEETRGKILEGLGYNIKINQGKFLTFGKDGYNIQINHFMIPHVFGVNGGRIFEIKISKDHIVFIWDNGWDKEPKNEDVKKIFDELVKYIN